MAERQMQRTGRSRTTYLAVGLVGIVVGVLAIVVGTAVMTDVTAVARVAVAGGGVVVTYLGITWLGRAWLGPRWSAAQPLAIAWLALVVLASIFADLLPLKESRDISKTFSEPSLARPDLFSAHPLGTDRNGLDILGGLVYGARMSLVVGLGAVFIAMMLGGAIGLLAGYFRGKADALVAIVSDSMLAFPPLVFLLAMVAVLDASVLNVTVALALLSVPTYIRLTRANTLVFAQREFVSAARALGASDRRIMLREVAPNVALPVLSYGFTVVAVLIVAEASLSFLGLSIQRPNPTWGNMIAAGQSDFQKHPHLVFVPGIVLFVTVFAFNRVGEGARRIWSARDSKL